MLPILATLALGTTPAAGPLVADPPSADRGEAPTGPQLVQVFKLTHRGDAGTLTITATETGCGCLKPTLSRDALRPGESAQLTIMVNTLTQPPGPNVWKAVVRYRVADPNGCPSPPSVTPDVSLELRVSARLVQEVSVTPPMLAVSTSTATTQTVVVTDRRSAPLTVRTATTTSPHLTAVVRPTTDAAPRSQAVDVTVTDSYPPGQSDETLVLLTTDRTCPELRVPIRVSKRKSGGVTVSPDAAAVRFARGQAEASALVQLRKPGGGELRVERVESAHPAVRAKWPATAGPVATVRVVVDREKTGGHGGRAEVRVWLADPVGESVVVPVSWANPE
ncbi:MAG TPA: DUF1573 domain-containing protein [Gemmataceae bacterium]|jgi:hypothetical protein|nr:DUF1573 domain-containing protein [Gemmataceae bacterium]